MAVCIINDVKILVNLFMSSAAFFTLTSLNNASVVEVLSLCLLFMMQLCVAILLITCSHVRRQDLK